MCHSAIGNLQCLLHTLHEVIDVVVDIWQVGQLCHGPQMASNGMSQTASNDTHMAAAQWHNDTWQQHNDEAKSLILLAVVELNQWLQAALKVTKEAVQT